MLLLAVAALSAASPPSRGQPETGRNATVTAAKAPAIATPKDFETFLDRLMQAESSGRDDARNPRSTATGSFQFIESTFLSIAARHFADETRNLTRTQILALRLDRKTARKAAAIYTRENAAYLAARGLTPTFPNLRLAFLLGPEGAVRVLAAKPQSPLRALVGTAVIKANPFMAGMTAAGLKARAARDIGYGNDRWLEVPKRALVAAKAKVRAGPPPPPPIDVKCNLALASCRQWLALAKKRQAKKYRQAQSTR